MQNLSTEQIVNVLIQQHEKLIEEANRVEAAIKIFKPTYSISNLKMDASEAVNMNTLSPQNSNLFGENIVSHKSSFEDLIKVKFKEIGFFIKLSSFIEEFLMEHKGFKSEEEIAGKVRRMKRKGELISVKFDDNFAKSYWGLSGWVKSQNGELVIVKDFFPTTSSEISESSTYEVIK